MKKLLLSILVVTLISGVTADAQEDYDLSTFLMRSTFQLKGEGSAGTAFIVRRASSADPSRYYRVLVTADHVLSRMKGDTATLVLRKKVDRGFAKLPLPIKIRDGKTALWRKHPDVDVAVMYVSIPEGTDLFPIPYTWFATDEQYRKYEIRPGDRLFCLGYPLGQAANAAGFPVQRSGTIASYPLIPMKETKTFLFDFEVYKGNSGGPVFLIDQARYYGGSFHVSEMIRLPVGLITQERGFVERISSMYEKELRVHPLKIGVVIHGAFIREAVESLPSLDKQPNKAMDSDKK